jgi:monoamine oxidase
LEDFVRDRRAGEAEFVPIGQEEKGATMERMLTRRQVLRRMGIAAGTVAGGQLLAACPEAPGAGGGGGTGEGGPHVVILGAGLAGLCAAYELEKKGWRVTIVEAERKHLGGRVRTLRFADGSHGEAGAMRIPAKHDLTRAYCREMGVGLRPFVQSNPNAYFFVRGRRVRNRDGKLLNALFSLREDERGLTSDDLWGKSVVAKLKAMSDAERAELVAEAPASGGYRAVDGLSLQSLVEASGLSQEAIELMAVTQGQEAEMQYGCSETLREEVKEVWAHEFDEIVGGTDVLPAAMARRIRGQIRQGCEVIAVAQDGAGVTATYVEGGRQETVRGDFLLCTLPAPVLQRVSAEFSFEKRRALRQVMYDSATKVLLGARRRFWEQDDGIFGGGTFTDLPTGSTYYPSDNAVDRAGAGPRDPGVSARPALFLASYSWGMPARRLAAMPHAQRVATVLRFLSKVHPQLNEGGMVTASASWSWDNHPWSGGAFAWFNPGQHSALYASLIAPEGRIYFAGEHASLSHTWMQGAFESALRAVAALSVAGVKARA